MIQKERVLRLNDRPIQSERRYVLYWMQASQRVEENPALSYAVQEANALRKPLVVVFGIIENFPEAGQRHYAFMLEGLQDVAASLQERNIRFVVTLDGPVYGTVALAKEAAEVITDRAYGAVERSWRAEVSAQVPCRLVQVESNVVVPVEQVSNKDEYSAATLRRKIEPMIAYYAQETTLEDIAIRSDDLEVPISEIGMDSIDTALDRIGADPTISRCDTVRGGALEANRRLDTFLERHLDGYAERHNDPADPYDSGLSPYLHFGQISPVTIYHRVFERAAPDASAFLEQLIVRRELAMNFVQFNPLYDRYDGLPDWARKTLEAHETDVRPIRYDSATLVAAETHDPYWNAAQKELVHLGTMHGYMRMYWGKKILEWSASPRSAYELALSMNNRYQLDGRDPNGFAGVAWCFGKHDRPWVERPIFGNVRYMNDRGLERKFEISAYVTRIERAVEAL